MSVADYQNARGMDHDGDVEEEQEMKVDIIDIIETEGRWGDRSTITLTADIHKARAEKQRYQDYAIIFRRLRNSDNVPKSTRLEIQSPIVQTGLRHVLGEYSTVNMDSDTITLDKPYAPLFHYREELREYAISKDRTKEERSHMDIIIQFMKKYLQEMERAYERLLPSELTTYNLLWTLFRPEEVVIARRDHFTEAHVVDSCSVTEIDRNGEAIMFLTLVGQYWDYNGARFGPVTMPLTIGHFVGNKKIRDLEVYPIAYHEEDDGEGLRGKLITRGMKWRKILDVTHREYDCTGRNNIHWPWTDPLPETAHTINDLVPIHTSGRIILDYVTHQQAKPQFATVLSRVSTTEMVSKRRSEILCDSDDENELTKIDELISNDAPQPEVASGDAPEPKTIEAKKSRYEDKYTSHRNNDSYIMTEAQALLAPARVRGFSLVDKMWAFFLVDKMEEIKWATDSFATLELEKNFKKTINALVHVHGDPSRKYEQFDDVIAGKGKGLIFLLTGPPGLGKTFTAESIAEETHKPLYAITSGELGTDVVQTDRILRQIFTRTKTWNAILLLDEADVFLAKRDRTDLERNAFVSVFLRLIEYYQSILFLTTDRADEFDEAFQSRIHLTIHYKPLDDVQRTVIWRNHLSRIDPGAWNEDTLKRLGKYTTMEEKLRILYEQRRRWRNMRVWIWPNSIFRQSLRLIRRFGQFPPTKVHHSILKSMMNSIIDCEKKPDSVDSKVDSCSLTHTILLAKSRGVALDLTKI